MKKRKPAPPPPEPKVTDETPLRHRAFGALEAMKAKLEAEAAQSGAKKPAPTPPLKPRASEPVKPRTDEVWRPDLDKDLLRVAMSGVKPLAQGKANARSPRAPGGPRGDIGAAARRLRAEGGDSIPVRWREDGTFEAARSGRSFALEALERFATIEHRLDLHGLNAVEAASRVGEFVRTRRVRGARVVAIVHGTGKHSPDGSCVLRDAVVKALSEQPVCRDVDAFRTAEAAHGGPGVTIVALRHA